MATVRTAKSYPITYKFGYSVAYGSGFHTGVDRGTPYGTPLIVNKTLIGYTGNTGYVLPAPTKKNPKAGSHLHLTRISFTGKLVDPKKTGFKLRHIGIRKPRVHKIGKDSRNGNYVIIKNWQGTQFYYCHLSKITCKVGDIIK